MKTASIAGAAACVAMLTLSSPAVADDDEDSVEIGVGVLGVLGGNFLGKPDDDDQLYPGFSGFTGGGGLMVEGRFFGAIGLEVDFIRSGDRGTGTVEAGNDVFGANVYRGDLEIGQTSWHVPILLKGVLDVPFASPFAVLGAEVVVPEDAEATLTPEAPPAVVRAAADQYVMLTGGIGIEIAPPLPFLDLRFPVAFRGSYNPSVSGALDGRTNYDFGNREFEYRSEWEFQALFVIGAALYL